MVPRDETGPPLILLLGGGTKRRQRTDVERAIALRAEYKARKAQAQRERPDDGR